LNVAPKDVFDFVATPTNWPKIVLSSFAVDGSGCDKVLPVGGQVDEIFGLPPLMPLRVQWTCIEADAPRDGNPNGRLTFSSPSGLDGVASDCFMRFAFASYGDGGTDLELEMEYAPTSPVATLGAPVLALDNALALKVLLPREIGRAKPPARQMMDPIAGPLVSAGRRLRLLPEAEAGGWTGEPTAWARSDSVPQRPSQLSQSRLSGVKQWVAERAAGEFDAEAIDRRLDGLIGSSDVLLFSFTNCPFCKGAKELLDAKGARYRVVELDLEPQGAAMRARLGARTGRTSVPSVWVAGECVGGLNDGPGLAPLDADGLLEPKLRAVGAMP
jgi:glutaredoxin